MQSPNEAFAEIRQFVPMYCDAVVIYGRSSSHWRPDKCPTSEISFAFHESPAVAEAAACEAMKYQHCDWVVVFERLVMTFCYGIPGGGEIAWVVRLAAGVDR